MSEKKKNAAAVALGLLSKRKNPGHCSRIGKIGGKAAKNRKYQPCTSPANTHRYKSHAWSGSGFCWWCKKTRQELEIHESVHLANVIPD